MQKANSEAHSPYTKPDAFTQLRNDNKELWDKTLYGPIQRFYAGIGAGRGTLIIGAGFGDETPQEFDGTLLDIMRDRIAVAKSQRPLSSAVCADATALPFADRSFDTAVLSMILSQLDPDSACKALSEACRVSASLYIIDSTKSTAGGIIPNSRVYTSTLSIADHAGINPSRLKRIGNPFTWIRNERNEFIIEQSYEVEFFAVVGKRRLF